jgi:putative membrane protein
MTNFANTLTKIFAVIVAFEHVYFLYLEMFLWNKPKGMKTFRMTQAHADATKSLAANQGLYNGFLAAGLVWALCAPADQARCIFMFFFACVAIAGIFAGFTVSKRIFILQGIPAIIGLAVSFFS